MAKPLDVIFEDNHLLVVVKPGGLPTQPTPLSDASLETEAKAWLKAKYHKSGNVYLHAIHRLDRPVSGVVVFAKTSKALSRLQASIRERKTKKTYIAWVEGILEGEGTFEDYLIHGDHVALLGKPHAPNSKLCRLHYKVLESKNQKTLVEIDLETGRYHQIRAQFGFRKYPIYGDRKYGSSTTLDHIALHHLAFSIPHPVGGEMMTFSRAPEFIPLA